LEPEILVVDEVLAVGDAQFQKKCLGKMDDVAQEGRTVIFVSHNMSAIEALCNRGIVLQSGSLCLDSGVPQAIQKYLEGAFNIIENISLEDRRDRRGSGKARFTHFRILNNQKHEVYSLQSGKDYFFEIQYLNDVDIDLKNIVVGLAVYDENNTRVLLLKNNFTKNNINLCKKTGCILCHVKNLPLANGLYRIALSLAYNNHETLDHVQDAASLTVDGGNFFGTGSQGEPMFCKILMKAEWMSN
jgi:lipopolysaccharide transport system ATP-binding protein